MAVAFANVFWCCGAACTPEQSRTANDVQDAVLRAKDIACIMGSFVVDPAELAKACDLADKLEKVVPVIRGLVGVRDAARRSGVTFQPTPIADGGADAR